ncbi:MAG: LssY C-terminal domain-containing protein [Methyloceanibacter sp.]
MTDPKILLLFVLAWAVAAYLIVPRLWELYFRHHPSLAELARVTHTSDGHPGDPINIHLVGSDAEVVRGMTAAGWFPADPITLATSVRIAADSVLRRSDDDAPVSNLFLFGRKQDLAFEQPVGGGPRRRHHVRFWRWDKLYEGRPAWIGAATFDERVGLSHTTGQVTHHISPDVDAERDHIASELQKVGLVQSIEWDNGFHSQLEGRNGGGDPWHTDGRLAILVLRGSATAALK